MIFIENNSITEFNIVIDDDIIKYNPTNILMRDSSLLLLNFCKYKLTGSINENLMGDN
jgi:hypothetical protein